MAYSLFGYCLKHGRALKRVFDNPKEPPVCVDCVGEERERLNRLFYNLSNDEDNAERARFGNIATPKGFRR